ncbi:hypothetical protein [Wocania ichthyoenteri]|uniref:hypothetical protein n=1 Tax=Wocania ichthyoenteri TaxID=1230531 RepID=UPI00053EBC99|nr:hypothetical protein [Wocania ichthyoenteri]
MQFQRTSEVNSPTKLASGLTEPIPRPLAIAWRIMNYPESEPSRYQVEKSLFLIDETLRFSNFPLNPDAERRGIL